LLGAKALFSAQTLGLRQLSRLQGHRAVAQESEREADDRPEQRILVAAALAVNTTRWLRGPDSREEQVNAEKDRNPSRIEPRMSASPRAFRTPRRPGDHSGSPGTRNTFRPAIPNTMALSRTMQNEQDAHATRSSNAPYGALSASIIFPFRSRLSRMRMRSFGLVDKAGAVAAVKADGTGSNPAA